MSLIFSTRLICSDSQKTAEDCHFFARDGSHNNDLFNAVLHIDSGFTRFIIATLTCAFAQSYLRANHDLLLQASERGLRQGGNSRHQGKQETTRPSHPRHRGHRRQGLLRNLARTEKAPRSRRNRICGKAEESVGQTAVAGKRTIDKIHN